MRKLMQARHFSAGIHMGKDGPKQFALLGRKVDAP